MPISSASTHQSTTTLPSPEIIAAQLRRARSALLLARRNEKESAEEVSRWRAEAKILRDKLNNEVTSLRQAISKCQYERSALELRLRLVHEGLPTELCKIDHTGAMEALRHIAIAPIDAKMPQSKHINHLGKMFATKLIEALRAVDLVSEANIKACSLQKESTHLASKVSALQSAESTHKSALTQARSDNAHAIKRLHEVEESLKRSERRGRWLTKQVRELQTLIQEKENLVANLKGRLKKQNSVETSSKDQEMSRFSKQESSAGSESRDCSNEICEVEFGRDIEKESPLRKYLSPENLRSASASALHFKAGSEDFLESRKSGRTVCAVNDECGMSMVMQSLRITSRLESPPRVKLLCE